MDRISNAGPHKSGFNGDSYGRWNSSDNLWQKRLFRNRFNQPIGSGSNDSMIDLIRELNTIKKNNYRGIRNVCMNGTRVSVIYVIIRQPTHRGSKRQILPKLNFSWPRLSHNDISGTFLNPRITVSCKDGLCTVVYIEKNQLQTQNNRNNFPKLETKRLKTFQSL